MYDEFWVVYTAAGLGLLCAALWLAFCLGAILARCGMKYDRPKWEQGWLIEIGPECCREYHEVGHWWTTEPKEATLYVRREDAERVLKNLQRHYEQFCAGGRVVFHQWG